MHFGDPQQIALVFRQPDATPLRGSLWIAGRSLTAHTVDLEVETRVEAPWAALGRWFIQAWPAFFETQRWPLPDRATNALRFWGHLQARLRSAGDRSRADIEQVAQRFCEGHRLGGRSWPDHLPQVFFNRENDDLVIAWTGPCAARPELRFQATEGEARIPIDDFVEAVGGFVEQAAQWSGGPTPDAVTRWQNALGSPAGARHAVRQQAGLSADETQALLDRSHLPFATFFDLSDDALSTGGCISAYASPVALALRSTTPRLDVRSRIALRNFIANEAPNARGARALSRLAEHLTRPDPNLPDYAQGYAMATTVRTWLGKPDAPLDIEALLTRMLSVPVRDVPLLDAETEGGCIWGESAGPAVFVNPEARMARTAWGRRMTLAHELCHLLLDRPPVRTLSHSSGLWSIPRLERRANAFAAELLLPQAALEQQRDDGAGYAEVMERYGVGLKTATWQVANRLDGELSSANDLPAQSAPAAVARVMTAGQYQVIFALLAQPGLLHFETGWIAEGAGASIAEVEEVFARLSHRGDLVVRSRRRHLANRARLAQWWLTGYGDVVRPTALLASERVRLPGNRDVALTALAERLNASRMSWFWSGEAAAWCKQPDLPPQHLVVLIDDSAAPDIGGEGTQEFTVDCLRLFCPAARGDEADQTAHPLLVWSELMQHPNDARVRELADALADELGISG